MVFVGTYAGVVLKDAAIFTVNRTNYCIGGEWQAIITGADADAPIKLVGVSNGVSWEWPHWGTTSSDGAFTATGVFLDGSQGTHSLHVEIGQVRSNTVSLAIQSCDASGTGYMPQLEIKLTNLSPDHQFCFGAAGVLTVSNGPPNASVTLVNAPPGFYIAPGAKTDSQGSFSMGFSIPYIGIGVYDFTFWAEVGGIRSNSLSITTFDCD